MPRSHVKILQMENFRNLTFPFSPFFSFLFPIVLLLSQCGVVVALPGV